MDKDEELINEEAPTEAPVEAKPKKAIIKLLPLIGVFVGLYIAAGVGNYFYLKATYVPPEPPKNISAVVEKKPVLKIDLGEPEPVVEVISVASESLVTETPKQSVNEDSLKKVQEDNIRLAESQKINTTVEELKSQIRQSDSLLVATRQELTAAKESPKEKATVSDSLALKKTAKLAKIVENMPAEEAAKMLLPLGDDMVIDILMRLKQRQAAQIMAALPATRSSRISETILKPIVQR
ncbi:MAG: hypothetical protein NTW14_08720 [bacterium]|nr:hypothetical protein [bacterium]